MGGGRCESYQNVMPVCTDQYKLLLRITGLVKKFCEERVNNNVRSSRGTSSQAGLAAKWVITRCTTRSVPVTQASPEIRQLSAPTLRTRRRAAGDW